MKSENEDGRIKAVRHVIWQMGRIQHDLKVHGGDVPALKVAEGIGGFMDALKAALEQNQ
jgi:hypothetical protein